MTENVVKGWRSTIFGVAILAFLAFCIVRDPGLLNNPASLVPLAGGLWAILGEKS